MSCTNQLRIAQGTTFVRPFRWGTEPFVYKAISAKVTGTPLTFTVTGHGLPPNWSVAFANVGYTELAIDGDGTKPPDADDFYEATTVDADTVAFNGIDAGRLTGAYTAGGSLVYMTPVSLAGSASFTVYDAAGTLVLTVAAVLNDTTKTITVTLTAVQTAALAVGSYTYALTATSVSNEVTQLGPTGELEILPLGAA
jgi:hypothetical protein